MPVANLNGFTKAKKRLIERGQFDITTAWIFWSASALSGPSATR